MGLFSRRNRGAKRPSSGSTINSDVLIDSIIDGFMLVNESGVITIFNPAAEKVTGWPVKDAVNLDYRSVMKFFDDKGMELADDQSPIKECFMLRKPVKKQSIHLRNNSGNMIELDVMASPVLSDKNEVLAVMAIFRDVSKERSEERQRAEFISTASHEMRTPVAAIEGYLALAMNDKVSKIDTAARGYLEKAHASTKHLGKLFQDLLTAAKSEDGRLTSHPVVIEVGVFLRDIVDRSRFSAEKKGLEVRYKISDSVIDTTKNKDGKVLEPIYYIFADPDRLREVITNIFDNAVKYTDDGQITIGMKSEANNIVMSITDTGHGISKEDLPHLFQKFYRVDNSDTRQIGGTGLGLFISKKIVELYGGQVWVESEINKGSTFNISIPQLDSAKAKSMMQQETANQSPLDSNSSPLPTRNSEEEKEPEKPATPPPATTIQPQTTPPPEKPAAPATAPVPTQQPATPAPAAPAPIEKPAAAPATAPPSTNTPSPKQA